MTEKIYYFSKEGLEKLKAELEELKAKIKSDSPPDWFMMMA